MSHRVRRLLAVVLGIVAFAAIGGAHALPVDGGGPPLAALPRDPGPRGLDVRLDDVVDAYRARGLAAARGAARGGGLELAGERIEVVVAADRGRRADARAALSARGAVVERSYGDLIKALVPVDRLAGLAAADGIRVVEPPQRAHAAAVSGQGISASNASIAHAAGDKGAGVKVGIVDVGFFGYTDSQAAGDLPGGVVTQSYCGDFEGGEHGTAVAEIVHEIAPAAELHLICVEDVVDLGAAKDYAVANGITIVNFSAGFYNSGRGDGTDGPDTPNGIVAAAAAAGVLWVASAGNEAESHWSGTFSGNGNLFHDFASGDEGINFVVPPNGQACLFLKWDAWPTTSTQDFDLGVYDAATFDLVDASAEDQATFNSSPTEAVCVSAPAEGKEYFAAIYRYLGTAPRLDLFVSGSTFTQHKVPSGSLLEPASSPAALAAAAICWNGGALEPYSSQGPTIDGRLKPDVAGFDSTSSGVYGLYDATAGCGRSGFTGTSAAAPHVAGIAAIVKQRQSSLTAAELRAYVEGTAADSGPVGADNAYGHGRLRLGVPPSASTLPATSIGRRVVQLRGSYNANRWDGSYRWQYATEPTFATSSSTPPTEYHWSGATTNSSVSAMLDGLEPATTYYARLVVENEHGTTTGATTSFTTATTAAPYVSLLDPTGITANASTLHGVVNPNGLTTTYKFLYGTAYPPATPLGEVTLTGDASSAVSAQLTGLTASRTYAFRLVATNSAGTTQEDGFLTTAAAAPPPPPPSAPPPSGGGGGGPDLGVVIGHGPSVVAAGGAFTYTFVIRNAAGAKATGVSLGFTLPEALELLSSYAEKGPGCSASSGLTFSCPLAFLDGLETTRVTATVRVRANGTLTATATVTSSERDANATDNLANYTFTAGPGVPAAQPPATPPVQVIPPAGVTKTGSASADTMYGAGGPDRLWGLGGADRLYGRAGNDRLFGGAGGDRLDGGAGRDLLDAGPGNDTIAARDRTADTIRCGRGRDTVYADRADAVARDCERVLRR